MSWPECYGGIEQTVRQLCMTTRSGHPVRNFVFSLSCRCNKPVVGHLNRAGMIRFPQTVEIASTGISLRSLLAFRAIARRMDVIHYHFPWPFGDLLHLLHGRGKPAIVTYHSDIIRQKHFLPFYRPLLHWFLGKMDRIVATSPNYIESSDTLRRFRENTSVIPLGLDKKSYPMVDNARLKKWQSIMGTDFFLFVGVLRYYKGLHQLLDACANTELRVVIVGAGPMEAEIQPRILKPELANVHLLGELNDQDKIALIRLCRGLVFPSHLRSEAFGLSLLEAAMHGKPMISSEIGTGTSFINIHNETGLVIPPDNPAALREAMFYLDNHPDKAKEMGKRARQRYLDYFTSQRMGEAYSNLYHEVVTDRTRRLHPFSADVSRSSSSHH